MSKREKIMWPEWVPIIDESRTFRVGDVFPGTARWRVYTALENEVEKRGGVYESAEVWNAAMRRLGYTVIVECDKWDHEA